MEPEQLRALLSRVIPIAVTAGERILEIYNTDFEVQTKADNSPLTAADQAAHHTIVDGLGRLETVYPVLSEESVDTDYAQRGQWSRYWLVDPLDGTREFVKRNGEFTVNIALIDGRRSILGVVYAPVTGLLYWGSLGNGAFRQRGESDPVPIQVTDYKQGAAQLRIAGSRSHPSPVLQDYLAKLPEHELVAVGSSLKICMVAAGEADLYPRFGPTSEWDTAAGQAVLEAAGGHLTDTTMKPLSYNKPTSLLNPEFFAFGGGEAPWGGYLASSES
ncbi:MAG: 3'(2'),5'-bisphosphate nucleotidase CysQ [Gammaproteobacteria bacterium]|nr:3'(2'),5'-bisphosphate nucleotidase CysQ [Gammaproteobacteria bacterium]